MTEECDRNPSPPKELLESSDDLVPDKIGETVFSKHWVFQCLIHVIQAVEKEDEKPEASSEKEQNETNNSGKEEGDKTEVLELNKELEEELCTLWDMSANNDVAHFLHEFKASNIFLGVIEKTKAPRLAEIAVGILGNMMFFNDICEDVSKNEELVKVLLLLLNSSDSPTLVQVVRLVHVCVVNKKARRTWLNSFKEIGSFVKTLQFILGNSLNVDLLKGTLQVVYYILHASEDFSLQFGSSEFVTAITAAAEQLRLKEAFEALDEYWHVIHLLSLNEDNLKILGECFHSIYKLLHVYVSKLCDNEDVVPSYERIGALTGGFATLVALLTPERLDEELFDRDRDFLSCLKTMLKSVQKKILVYKKQTLHEESESRAMSQKDSEGDINENVKESKNTKNSSNEKTDAQSTDITSSLEILEDSLSHLCFIIIPSIKQEDEVKKALLEALKDCRKSSQGACSKNLSPSV